MAKHLQKKKEEERNTLTNDKWIEGNGQRRRRRGSSFFTIARFEPDSMVVYSLLVTMAVVLYLNGFNYFSLIPAATLAVIFMVEASETIRLDYLPEKQIVGERCTVITRISKAERGVVRILNSRGVEDWELWSAESDYGLEKGSTALVTGVKSGIILHVAPVVEKMEEMSPSVIHIN